MFDGQEREVIVSRPGADEEFPDVKVNPVFIGQIGGRDLLSLVFGLQYFGKVGLEGRFAPNKIQPPVFRQAPGTVIEEGAKGNQND